MRSCLSVLLSCFVRFVWAGRLARHLGLDFGVGSVFGLGVCVLLDRFLIGCSRAPLKDLVTPSF